jgi:purine-binding chemotaxis protein CheW
VESGQIEDVPAADNESIEAIAKIDDRLVILLNPTGIFASAAAVTAAGEASSNGVVDLAIA